jgi:hypothetical protein
MAPGVFIFGAVCVVSFEESTVMVMFMKGDDGEWGVECRVIT